MTDEQQYDQEGEGAEDDYNSYNDGGGDDWDSRKAFVSRIPTNFDADSVKRILEKKFGDGCVEDVSIVYSREGGDGNEERGDGGVSKRVDYRAAGGAFDGDNTNKKQGSTEDEKREHRGFGFVTFFESSVRDEAVKAGTARGGAKDTSKRKHTLYIRPLDRSGDDEANEADGAADNHVSKNACHLWSLHRCPYGEDCKFDHVGEGGCIENSKSKEPLSKAERDKKKKCFSFKKKGKCKLGDACPFSHQVGANNTASSKNDEKEKDDKGKKDVSEKDCINWKTKGKCRKLNSKKGCPYRHDEAVGKAAFAKKEDKKRKRDAASSNDAKAGKGSKEEKVKQPLSVRVFGMNYDTKEEDIRDFFKSCGPIVEITFPTFEDSGRSKGYCGVLFQSPKAVEKALLLNEAELHGRWLSVQAGKMLLREWEERERQSRGHRGDKDAGEDQDTNTAEPAKEMAPTAEVGEYGQKVKKRKKHGYKE